MNLIEITQKYVLNTYQRAKVVFVKGKGVYLYSTEGERYIDLFPGWGVSILGHTHPRISKVISQQAKRLIHLPNNFYNEFQGELAKEIVKRAFKGKVFFCNSGAESVETAIKFCRAWGKFWNKYEIISMRNSFHGRTMGALSLTAQKKYQLPFKPLLKGAKFCKFNDIKDFKKKLTPKTCAVFLELIQGEGGVNVADTDFIKKVYQICKEKNILFIVDEVQTGMGRCGSWFLFKDYQIIPDGMCLSKGLGAGFPIGAFVAQIDKADVFKPGMHASTFGGGPLACRVALEVFKIIEEEDLMKRVRVLSKEIFERIYKLKNRFKVIKEVRGKGFMIGIELKASAHKIAERAFKNKLLINCTHQRILRLLPALNTPEKLLHKGLDILEFCFKKEFK